MSEQIILLENIIEEYAWVDKLLEEKYNLYALTEENIDDFINAGLLVEQYNYIDKKLEDNCASISSGHSYISNPFCNIEVEQHFNSNLDLISELSSNDYSNEIFLDTSSKDTSSKDTSSNNSIFDELADAYDSDDYYQHLGDNNRLFCFN